MGNSVGGSSGSASSHSVYDSVSSATVDDSLYACAWKQKHEQGREYHEMEFCEDDEGELQEKKLYCHKNPGHKKFIPVSEFQPQHLPLGYRDPLVWTYIQALIALTVRVVVRYTTRGRPKNYPRYDIRGRTYNYFGSGSVREIHRSYALRDEDTCPCGDCRKLPWTSRKKRWGEFVVLTARHVVFDDDECHYTTCDVGFDQDSDRGNCPNLQGVGIWHSDLMSDYSKVICVTHDEQVARMLEEKLGVCQDVYGRLRDMYMRSSRSLRGKPPVICVSHPHGMAKQVSVGDYKWRTRARPHKWRYTTETCPGSSGAPVTRLGRKWWLHRGLTTHSGCTAKGENESSWLGWFVLIFCFCIFFEK